MKRQLVVISAEGSTRKVDLSGTPISLGRANSNQLCYPEESRLSRSHAVFERADHGWVVCPTRDIVNTLDRAHGEHFFLLLV